MDKRIAGYDFIRSFAILFVFLDHALSGQTADLLKTASFFTRSVSPGITMSLLGFISAALLSSRDYDFGAFLIKRLSRIYISLILCLTIVLCAHALLGKKVITQHALLHLMGLSAFFDLFAVQNNATIGFGLWFITAINLMYLLFPLLQKLFRHPRGLVHLCGFILICIALNFTMYGMMSVWNVIISFALGIYFGIHGYTKRLIDPKTNMLIPTLGCIALLFVATLATAHIVPYSMRGLLLPFYPIAFIPVLFGVSRKLPVKVTAVSSFFAGLSYEFYILHFYFIGEGFKDFFPAATPFYGQITLAFVVTFVLAYGISKIACWLRKTADDYLLAR